jgi:RNA polymerase sigma-70 factor, ECF subfamily
LQILSIQEIAYTGTSNSEKIAGLLTRNSDGCLMPLRADFSGGGRLLGKVHMRPAGFDSRRTFPPPTQSDLSSTFEQLALPLLNSAYNFAYWLAQDRDNAEDLVQETYLKAFRAFRSFQPGTNFRAWIFQILKNTFLNSCSDAKRVNTIPLDSEGVLSELPVNSSSAESTLLERVGSDRIRRAIEELPIAFREVILLRDVEGASYREISQILSIPIGTVMSRLARARKLVRELLSGGTLQSTNQPLRSWSAS